MIDVGKVILRLDGFKGREEEDIKRCLMTLYSVREGEQPLDRNFGINNLFLDQPPAVAKNIFVLEVISKTKQYESRVDIEKVDFNYDKAGQLIPIIYAKRGANV